MSGSKKGQKKVSWTPENDNKLLIQLMDTTSRPDYIQIASTFADEGATPKAIEERHAKLKRWKKSNTYPHANAVGSSSAPTTKLPSTGATKTSSTTGATSNKPSTSKKTTKSAHTGSDFVLQGAPAGPTIKKRTRASANPKGGKGDKVGKTARENAEVSEEDSESGSESASESGKEEVVSKKVKEDEGSETDMKSDDEGDEKEPLAKSVKRGKRAVAKKEVKVVKGGKSKGNGRGKRVKKAKSESEDEGKVDVKAERKLEKGNKDEGKGFGGARRMVGDATAIVIDEDDELKKDESDDDNGMEGIKSE